MSMLTDIEKLKENHQALTNLIAILTERVIVLEKGLDNLIRSQVK